MIKLTECPRDAMQGIRRFIPTDVKVAYLNELLQVGFDTLDFGSFVSPTAIPQMRDTAAVIERLRWHDTTTRLLAIVANERGARDACQHEAIAYLGYPLSVSETFQMRNTRKSISQSRTELAGIIALAKKSNKQVVAYISMGFGNPYGDPYNGDLLMPFIDNLAAMGADVISLADTVGMADPDQVTSLFSAVKRDFPELDCGVHLHARPENTRAMVAAAYTSGCRRFDGALGGYGGCPMAKDELVGNLATEKIVGYLEEQGESFSFNPVAMERSLRMTAEIFSNH